MDDTNGFIDGNDDYNLSLIVARLSRRLHALEERNRELEDTVQAFGNVLKDIVATDRAVDRMSAGLRAEFSVIGQKLSALRRLIADPAAEADPLPVIAIAPRRQ